MKTCTAEPLYKRQCLNCRRHYLVPNWKRINKSASILLKNYLSPCEFFFFFLINWKLLARVRFKNMQRKILKEILCHHFTPYQKRRLRIALTNKSLSEISVLYDVETILKKINVSFIFPICFSFDTFLTYLIICFLFVCFFIVSCYISCNSYLSIIQLGNPSITKYPSLLLLVMVSEHFGHVWFGTDKSNVSIE